MNSAYILNSVAFIKETDCVLYEVGTELCMTEADICLQTLNIISNVLTYSSDRV